MTLASRPSQADNESVLKGVSGSGITVRQQGCSSLSRTAIFSSIDAVLCCCESSRVIVAAYSDCSDGSFMKHAALGFRAHPAGRLSSISLEEGSACPFA